MTQNQQVRAKLCQLSTKIDVHGSLARLWNDERTFSYARDN